MLKNKVAIITGSASGIGLAAGKALAKEGTVTIFAHRKTPKKAELAREKYNCFINKKLNDNKENSLLVPKGDEQSLKATVEEIKKTGGKAVIFPCDIRYYEQVAGLVDMAMTTYGRLDIFINNAGVGMPGTIANGDVDDWHEMIETNIYGTLICCKEAIKAMRKCESKGCIVNITSLGARKPSFPMAVYTASKSAVVALSEALRQEVASDRIRIINIEPGLVLTNFQRYDAEVELEQLSDMINAHRVEYLSSEDIAQAILYTIKQPEKVSVSELVVQTTKNYPPV